MVPMGANTDEWIADVANYVRNAFGNAGRPLITPEQVAAVRRTARRNSPWTLAALDADGARARCRRARSGSCPPVTTRPPRPTRIGTTPGARWDTATAQAPGMWFQIELPQPTNVAEVQIDSAPLTGRATGGQGGFGGLGTVRSASAPRAGGAGARGAGGAPGRGAAPAGGAARAGGGGRGRGAALPPRRVRCPSASRPRPMARHGRTAGRRCWRFANNRHHVVQADDGEVRPDHADRHGTRRRVLGDSADAACTRCATRTR